MTSNRLLKIFCVTAIGVTIFSSCNKFLEEPPSKNSSVVIKTTAQLDALLNSYATFYLEANRTAIYSTDDFGLTTALYNARPASFPMAAVQFNFWDTQYIPNDTQEGFWSGEYRKIFNANLTLENLEKVSGTVEEKAILKADAHLIRAYSYWVLANTYCLPYTDATKDEVGLPIKTATTFEEPFVRRPLKDVYALIESDLAEALKINLPLMQGGKPRHWRANKAAVNGFAARYWLNRNNYTEAVKYANAALSEYNVLVDYNAQMRYGRDRVITIDAATPNAKSVTLKFPYTHDNSDVTDIIGWKEFLYLRVLSHSSLWYVPSQDLLNLYDKTHDLRYRYHIVEGYSYDRGMTKPSFDYPGYIFFFKDRMPSGPTVAEMYLIKAEGLARTNAISDAMTTLNTLRASRMEPGAWVNLTAGSKDEAIRNVINERRREIPFAQRWYDIRRYNNNEDPNDDVVLTKTFYPFNISTVLVNEPVKTYTLPKNSRRFAAPLPGTEMISSEGVIEQNKY